MAANHSCICVVNAPPLFGEGLLIWLRALVSQIAVLKENVAKRWPWDSWAGQAYWPHEGGVYGITVQADCGYTNYKTMYNLWYKDR